METGPGGDDDDEVSAVKRNTNTRDLIFITGQEENCLRAQEALPSLVPGDPVVQVPNRFHGAIIGERGGNISSMRVTYWVGIKVLPRREKKDCVYLQGFPSNNDKAKEAILKLVTRLQDEERELLQNCRSEVQLSPENLLEDEIVEEDHAYMYVQGQISSLEEAEKPI